MRLLDKLPDAGGINLDSGPHGGGYGNSSHIDPFAGGRFEAHDALDKRVDVLDEFLDAEGLQYWCRR